MGGGGELCWMVVEGCVGWWWRAVLDGGGGVLGGRGEVCWEVVAGNSEDGRSHSCKILMGLVSILTGMREEGSILNPFKCYNLLR